MQKLPYVFPIIGGRKVEQLQQNIAALDISLTPEQVQRIEQAAPFDPGFPGNLIVCVVFIYYWHLTITAFQGDGTFDNFMLKTSAHLERVPVQQPITPAKK